MRLLAVIPARNEGPFIGEVARRARRHVDDVVVIDDGSADDTAVRAPCRVVSLGHHHGKGAALKVGFALAAGFDAVVTLDGDGQHDPDDVPALVGALERADLVLGVRARGAAMPPIRRLSNGSSAALVTLVTRRRLRDVHTGFRAIRSAVLARVTSPEPGFEFEADFLLRAMAAGFRIAEAPVATIYGRERSKIRPVRDALGFLRVVGYNALRLR